MKWSVSSTLGRNLDVLAEEESEEEEVDDGHKREVSHNVTVHAGMKRSDFQFKKKKMLYVFSPKSNIKNIST